MKLTLPFPPSVNTYWRSPNSGPLAGRHLISAKGRQYRSDTTAAVIEQLRKIPKPFSAELSVNVVLYPPENRRRDLDNYLKALFDSLTHANVWEDDSQIKHMEVSWGPLIPKGSTEITIREFINETVTGAAAGQ
ncbi:RusA family crossover junction endodeoxyribonuclease [Buttiauxella sp. B2]|uniref:RusA family crossover junction endodeoxyribonuclease n=1 Tax=Buttiauxella sp. B2 TaxID=2587812 RepID=UPI00112460C8|nr:RusA family crossover junction endodeoxyribonuclease [Buttiauxella sp. B2]TNV14927.1 RusA family crossover junction endodeoxyribonuclease [Buttiauxella sp. B2]